MRENARERLALALGAADQASCQRVILCWEPIFIHIQHTHSHTHRKDLAYKRTCEWRIKAKVEISARTENGRTSERMNERK